MSEKNRVIKADSNQFWVEREGKIIKCGARSKLKKDACLVGDFVSFDISANEPIISGIIPRKNKLIRPYIANVDQIIIMVAAVPEIDFMLIDKLLINAARQDIETVICVNKTDISLDCYSLVAQEYQGIADKIVKSCAINGEIEEIKSLLAGKLTCIAGQSAVGKSTIINALLGSDNQKIGDISKKIARGKNTTTASEIFAVCGGYIADTPGFSMLDIFDILPEEINLYYPEFDRFRGECRFSTCTHTIEPQCAVCDAAKRGDISENRLDRYKRIYGEAKEYLERNPKQKTRSE